MVALGKLVLMGSGELTSTMVELHKELLAGLGPSPQPVFLDTPAGFQLNADELSARAVAYFRDRVGVELQVASLKSSALPEVEAGLGHQRLREADYVLVGPGSPTYAVRTWRQGPVPALLGELVERGGCLVAASAAALTVGRFTLPVYEVYKVGEEPHWVEGIDLLGRFGLDLAVVPHWNNAEGGTHDTRFCYMGEPRFRQLEDALPEGTGVLGLDEHTACLIDLERRVLSVRGLGRATLRHRGREVFLERGSAYPLEILSGRHRSQPSVPPQDTGTAPVEGSADSESGEGTLWDQLHDQAERFRRGLDGGDPATATTALLEVDRLLWAAHLDLDDPESVSQGRELLRELLVRLGTRLVALPPSAEACLAPLVEALLEYRRQLRVDGRYAEADGVRDCLSAAGVVVEDDQKGARWRL